ncbi:MAG: DUF2142 domain-containing protein [Anaerolineales bacterium]
MEEEKMINKIKELWTEHGRLHSAEIYLIIGLLVFGTIACFLLPVSGGFDEEEHFIRVWEMSTYTFIPNDKLGKELPFPIVFQAMSYRRKFIVRAVPTDFWEKYKNLSFDSMGYIRKIDTRSVYSPPLLLPQALTLRLLGRREHLPALTVFYACRLAGLLSYLFLSFLAIRITPYGKWLLAIIATSPIAILQSATITPDIISNGIAFLFIAGCLTIAQRKELKWQDLAALATLVFVLFWGKINIVPLVILPFLIIPPSHYKIKFGYWIFLIISILFFAIEVAGWNLLAYTRYHDALSGANPIGQVKFILSNPIHFASILIGNIKSNYLGYLNSWAAIYAFGYWPVPIWTYYFYGIGLLATLFIKENDQTPSSLTRWGLFITFIATYLWTIVSLYLTYTPVGSDLILGVQGRYFAGVMPLLFLALACLPFLKGLRIPSYIPLLSGGTTLLLYVVGMYLSYHVVCGSQYYTGGLCQQPNYKNWAPNNLYSPPISKNLSLKQDVIVECSNMKEFRVWIDASNADPKANTEFSLINAKTGLLVASTSISNASLPKKDWYTLQFSPILDSNGARYILNIHSNAESGKGPRVSYSLKQEYPEGTLYENKDTIDKDIIFQWACVAGWEK